MKNVSGNSSAASDLNLVNSRPLPKGKWRSFACSRRLPYQWNFTPELDLARRIVVIRHAKAILDPPK